MNKTVLAATFFAVAAFGTACERSTTGSSTANNTSADNTNVNRSNANHAGMDHSTMDHSKMDHSTMDHSSMTSSPNAANAPLDLQFIDTMIVHHEGAVDMARMVSSRTQNPALRKFAEDIERDQQKEIDQMKGFRDKWYSGQPAAINMEMPGMKESMDMDMTRLAAAKDKEFDVMFAEMMIPHHVGAVRMSEDLIAKGEHAELKTLANQIIKAQNAEIKQMELWKTEWAK